MSEPAAPPSPTGPVPGDSSPAGAIRDTPGATWACVAICAAGLAVAVVMVLRSNNVLWYDETVYLGSVPELHRVGLSLEWLRDIPGAAGPLHALVHALLEPLTGLHAPAIRLATVVMSLLTVAALGAAMRARGIPHAYPKAVGLLAVPMLYGPIALAMTEMPAALFFCLSLAALFPARNRAERGERGASALAALAGVACAVSIAGRQHYLTGPIAALLLCRRPTRRVALIYALLAVGLPTPMFLLWGGLVPPAFASQSPGGFSLEHGLSAFSYGGVTYCLFDIGWLLRRWRTAAGLVAATTALNVSLGLVSHFPLHMTAMRYLSPTALAYYGLITSGVMLGFGVAFLVHLVRIAVERRHDPGELFLCAATAMLLVAPAKIVHMFAGRYIATAVPLILILGSERAPDTYGKAFRLALGCVAGLISLRAYLLQG